MYGNLRSFRDTRACGQVAYGALFIPTATGLTGMKLLSNAHTKPNCPHALDMEFVVES